MLAHTFIHTPPVSPPPIHTLFVPAPHLQINRGLAMHGAGRIDSTSQAALALIAASGVSDVVSVGMGTSQAWVDDGLAAMGLLGRLEGIGGTEAADVMDRVTKRASTILGDPIA